MKPWFGLIGLILAGCSPGALSVGDYVDAMEAVTVVYVADSQDLSLQYQDQVISEITEMAQSEPSDADVLALAITRSATTEYLDVLADQMLRFVDDMEAMAPPTAVGKEHDEYVAAVQSVYTAMPNTITDVGEADSLDGIRLALTASGFADGQIRWTVACTTLESSVRALGSGLDLGCVRPEIVP